jgi:RNA polymerase sigma factor (sigma-70 family)
VQGKPSPDLPIEERDAVWQAILRLPARQRACLVLRYYEELTEQETADILRCSVGTVKSQTSRALSRLRRELHNEA